MGAIIKAVTTSQVGKETSYLESGSEAVRQCMEIALSDSETLDFLINAGIYPDANIHEPSFASLIQGHLSKSHAAQLKGSFSFDLHNGGGGSLMALSILNGFIESGKIQHGMVVAGDSKPMDSQAGAVLIGMGGLHEGFQAFSQETYAQYTGEYESYSNYTGIELKTFISQEDTYTDYCLQCVGNSVENFLSDLGLRLAEIDLFISSQSPAGFVSGLSALFGTNRVMALSGEQPCYSAGLILAMAQAHSEGTFSPSEKVMFINVGPGIIVDLALYVNPV